MQLRHVYHKVRPICVHSIGPYLPSFTSKLRRLFTHLFEEIHSDCLLQGGHQASCYIGIMDQVRLLRVLRAVVPCYTNADVTILTTEKTMCLPQETLVSLGPWWSWFVVQSEQMLRGRGRGEGCPGEPALSGLKPP